MSLVRVPVPWRGMNTSAEGDSLASGEGQLLQNILPGVRGRILQRGGFGFVATLPPSDKDGFSYGAGSYWISPDNAGSAFLQQANGSTVSRNGATPVALPSGASYITPCHVRMGTYTVGVTNGTSNNLMTWNGTGTFVVVTNGPTQVESCAAHLSRVFTINSSGQLKWTDPNPDLTTNLAATWQDDVSGLTNLIQLPKGEWYRDLAVYNRVLYIFSDQSVYGLFGDTPANFIIRKVLEVGVNTASGYSLSGHTTTTERGLYFYSRSGIMRFDGATAEVIDEPVAKLTRIGIYARLTNVGDGYVSVIVAGSWLVYHEATGAWASFTSALFPYSGLHDKAGLPTHVRRAGSSTWAFSPGNGTNTGAWVNLTNTIGIRPSLFSTDYDNAAAPYPIDAQALSAPVRLTTPDRKATIRRLYAQAGSTAWTVQVEDEDETVIGSATPVSGSARGRAEADFFSERDIVQVRWIANLAASVTGDGTMSASDAYLQADSAQQR